MDSVDWPREIGILGKGNHGFKTFSIPWRHGEVEIDFIQGPGKTPTASANFSKLFPSSTGSAVTECPQISGYLNLIYIAC